MTKDDILKAAKCCKNNSCPECPMIDDMNCYTVFVDYFLDHIKNEPAPTAIGTSSEVSLSNDTNSLAQFDDSTKKAICQEAHRGCKSCDLPTRCIDPVIKDCQDCRYGHVVYGDDVECYADLQGCCFDTVCSLGFDRGRPEDEPTEEEIRKFEDEMRRSECQ